MSFRAGHAARSVCILAAVVLLGGVSASCADWTAPATEQLWVADNVAQCNEFDEPYRECLIVSHLEHNLYRHIEGSIEGFDYSEGTKYLLEVEPVTDPPAGSAPYRLVKILSEE